MRVCLVWYLFVHCLWIVCLFGFVWLSTQKLDEMGWVGQVQHQGKQCGVGDWGFYFFRSGTALGKLFRTNSPVDLFVFQHSRETRHAKLSGAFQEHSECFLGAPGDFRLLSGCFPGAFWVLSGCFPGAFRVLSGCISGADFKTFNWVFHELYRFVGVLYK